MVVRTSDTVSMGELSTTRPRPVPDSRSVFRMTIHASAILIAHLGLLAVGLWLFVIDARTHRLPNKIVLPTLVVTLLAVTLEAMLSAQTAALVRALLGMLALGGFYLLLRMISREGMGGGDVKLAALIGLVLAWHSWQTLLLGAASAFVMASAYVLILLALGKATRHSRVAFGPWMIIGAILGIAVA